LDLLVRRKQFLFSGNTSTSSPTAIDSFLIYTSTSFSNINVPIGPGPDKFLQTLAALHLTFAAESIGNENFGIQDGLTDFTVRITFTDPIIVGRPNDFRRRRFGTISRSGNSNNIGHGSLLTIDIDNTAHHFTL